MSGSCQRVVGLSLRAETYPSTSAGDPTPVVEFTAHLRDEVGWMLRVIRLHEIVIVGGGLDSLVIVTAHGGMEVSGFLRVDWKDRFQGSSRGNNRNAVDLTIGSWSSTKPRASERKFD